MFWELSRLRALGIRNGEFHTSFIEKSIKGDVITTTTDCRVDHSYANSLF